MAFGRIEAPQGPPPIVYQPILNVHEARAAELKKIFAQLEQTGTSIYSEADLKAFEKELDVLELKKIPENKELAKKEQQEIVLFKEEDAKKPRPLQEGQGNFLDSYA